MQRLFFALMACFVAVGSGCEARDERQALSGSVTFGAQPLAHGSIRFEPLAAEHAQASGAVIANGRYRIEREQGLLPGNYRVAISSPRVDAAATPSMDRSGPAEEQIPARYNTNSELQIAVERGGPNEFHFDLVTHNTE